LIGANLLFSDDETITFSVRQKAMGWLAVGFNYDGAMITSDVVLAFNNGTDVFGVSISSIFRRQHSAYVNTEILPSQYHRTVGHVER
jgi:hypothetical protein